MTPVDYTLLAIVAASAVIGAFRGFLREIISLVTWVVALWAGWHYAELVAPHLVGVLAEEPVRTWVARTVVVLGVLLVGTLIGVAANYFVRMTLFSGLDRFLGFVFGLLRGGIVLGVFAILGEVLEIDRAPWWRSSTLMPYAEVSADLIRKLVGDRPIEMLALQTVD
jgi:membrane protein required for colicin V production